MKEIRYYWHPARPELQPIGPPAMSVEYWESLEEGGWKRVDRSEYTARVEAWREWKDEQEGE